MSRTDPVSPWRRRVEAEVARQVEPLGGDPGEVLRALPDDVLAAVTQATHDHVPVEGVAAIGRAIRAAWLADPSLLARAPTFPPKEALAVVERLMAAGDRQAAERFMEGHREAVEVAQASRQAAAEAAQRRQREAAQAAHDLSHEAASAQERARVAEVQASEVERRLAAMPPVQPNTIGEVERARVLTRVRELRASAEAARADAARIVAEAAQAAAALAAHTSAAPTL